jgi:hypothetical protein
MKRLLLLSLIGLVGCSKGRCEPCGKDADCSSGLACDPQAHICDALGEQTITCEARCPASPQCLQTGECTLKDGKCQTLSDADCQKSYLCKEKGKCTYAAKARLGDDHCEATRVEDCEKSGGCRSNDRCLLDAELRICRGAPKP